MLAGALTAGVILVGAAPPALAAETTRASGPAPGTAATYPETATLSAGCSVVHDERTYTLEFSVQYTDSSVVGPRTWDHFRFRVHGGSVEEDKNNVNITMTEDGVQIFRYRSPDRLEYNRWYDLRTSSPVRTVIGWPGGIIDLRNNARIDVEAIFDNVPTDPIPWDGNDPRCTTARTSR